jgi:hypothetical protein
MVLDTRLARPVELLRFRRKSRVAERCSTRDARINLTAFRPTLYFLYMESYTYTLVLPASSCSLLRAPAPGIGCNLYDVSGIGKVDQHTSLLWIHTSHCTPAALVLTSSCQRGRLLQRPFAILHTLIRRTAAGCPQQC